MKENDILENYKGVFGNVNNTQTEYNGFIDYEDFMTDEKLRKGKILTFYDTSNGRRTGRVIKVKVLYSYYEGSCIGGCWWNTGKLISDKVLPKTKHTIEVDKKTFKDKSIIILKDDNYKEDELLEITCEDKKYLAEITKITKPQGLKEGYSLLHLIKAPYCYQEDYNKPKEEPKKKKELTQYQQILKQLHPDIPEELLDEFSESPIDMSGYTFEDIINTLNNLSNS